LHGLCLQLSDEQTTSSTHPHQPKTTRMRAFNAVQALTIALCLPLASAFKNSSPFFLSSSSP
jgi:hypothetical protein